MLNAKIDGINIKEFIISLSAFITEATLNINETGISSRAIDQSGVALAETFLAANAFTEYKASNCKVGLPLSSLKEMTELIDDDDEVSIFLNKETQTLDVSIGGMAYNITLIDISSIKKPIQVALPDNPAKVVVRGVHLKRAFKASNKLSEFIYMSVSRKRFTVKATGTLSKVTLDLDKEKLISLESNGNRIKMLFSLNYIADIASTLRNKSDITLELSEGYPLKLSTLIANGMGRAVFYIAPRVEHE